MLRSFVGRLSCNPRFYCVVTGPDHWPKGKIRHGLVGIGQPLLDFTVPMTPNRIELLLDSFGTLANTDEATALKRVTEISSSLFEEFTSDVGYTSSSRPTILPGGATLNALRVAQWLLETEPATTFVGCVGNDDDAERLIELTKLSGVNPVYETIDGEATGKCLHIVTDESTETEGFGDSLESYRLLTYPGAATRLCLSTLQQPLARLAISSSSYILASLTIAQQSRNASEAHLGSQLLIGLSEFASSMDRIFCLRLPPSSYSPEMAPSRPTGSADALSPSQWIELLANVDILFSDLGSALDVAQTLADWKSISADTDPIPERPDIKKRFAEFAASVLLSQTTASVSSSRKTLFDPTVHSLAACMPGLAERLGFCLAHLPKRNAKRARVVVLLGAGSAAGGMVACTSTGELYRLSDFVTRGSQQFGSVPAALMARLGAARSPTDLLLHGDGTGKAADAFIGALLAKLMAGSCVAGTQNSLVEALIVAARVARVVSHDKAGSFPKKLPMELKLAMAGQEAFSV